MINKEYDIMQEYGFEYTNCDGKVYKKQISTAGASWHECLNDYVRFLESIFQYNIMNQVRLEKSMYLEAMHEHYATYLDPWTGEYFSYEDETEDTLTSKYGWDD